MKRTLIEELQFDMPSKISGFVEKLRDTKYMVFVVLKDVSGRVQVSIDKATQDDLVKTALLGVIGSVVTFEGKLVKSEYVKMGGKEFLPTSVVIESVADASPIQDDASTELKSDYRWLDLRSDKNTLIFKAQTVFVNAMREYLLNNKFIEIHTPKLIGAASESGSDVFEVKYFDRKAYLAQSPQFYKQMAMASGFDRIFEIGPVFRAEKSYTNKHTTEFTGFDLEMSYIESFEDVMDIEANLLVSALKKVKEAYGEQIKESFGVDIVVPTLPFPKMKLADIYSELEKRYGFTVPDEEKNDLTTEAERMCEKLAKDMFNHEFIFVTDFPKDKRAFYHMRKDGVLQGYDLIWKGVEITTGAQREHRYDILKKQADEKGLGEDIKFYLEFFKYGCPPHGGFGLGVDRLTMVLLNLPIREAMFLFRSPNRLNP